jgi:hypothetical protein
MLQCDGTGKQSESDVKGKPQPEPGGYHVVIGEWREAKSGPKGPGFDVAVLEVLSGNVPGQEGREIVHHLWRDKDTGGAQEQHVRFAMATKLLGPNECRDVDLAEARGRQIWVCVGKRKKGDQEFLEVTHWGLDVWSLDNPEIIECRKFFHAEAAKYAGFNFSANGPESAPAPVSPAPPVAPPTPPPASTPPAATPAVAPQCAGVNSPAAPAAKKDPWASI